MLHAKLSPSSSSRWLGCTASVKACEPYDNFGNEASRWGTACHFIGENMLLETPIPSIGQTIEGTVVDKEMLDTAEEYADYVRGFMLPDSMLFVEERYDLSFIAPNTFGTGDAGVLNDTHLHIFDLKTGHNIVKAEENTQMMLYALGALEKLKDEWIEEVTLHIVQTRAGHVSTWTTTVERLEEFKRFAKEQADKILNDEVEFNPSDKACQWCLHKTNCEALAKYVEDIVTGEFEDLDAIDDTKAVEALPEHISKIMVNKDLILSYIKSIEMVALERMQNGESLEGFKLVRSRKHKRWSDTEAVEKYLVRKLKKVGAYSTPKLITPAQAVKALGKENSKFIEKFIEIPEGDVVIAPESDKREAVQSVVDDFDDIS